MRAVTLAGYVSFRCMAGLCPSTCCAGWNILVDEKDYDRFQVLEPEWLRQDVLYNIKKSGEHYYFKNHKDGRCAMLDQDGLCRIQRNTAEDMLCNTCRKYPRLINEVEGTVYLSMAASCPVVSEYLVKDTVLWNVIKDSKKAVKTAGGISLSESAWKQYQELWQAAIRFCGQQPDASFLYPCFENMAAEVLDISIHYSENCIPADYFRVLEKDVSGRIPVFVEKEAKRWKKILDNYMNYRILSRKIEYPAENDQNSIRQVQGELFLLRTLAFCRFCEREMLLDADWEELMQRVYRFCAHGKNVAGAFKELLERFFEQDALWSCMLI